MSLRIGLNIHNKARGGQERSAEEKRYLPEFLRKLNPSAIVVMDDLPFAEAMYATLPNTITTYRQYNPVEGHLWKVIAPEQYFINQKGISKSGIPLYCMNEPDSKAPVADLRDQTKWLVRVMELYAAAGLSLVVDNLGAYHPDFSWFTDLEKWAAVKPLFEAFKRFPMHFWGLHPYWSPDGLHPERGGVARHKDIEQHLKALGMDMPPVIFTEMGRDQYGENDTRNGWRSTGISEEAYGAEIEEAQTTLWTEPYIRGACLFCYGSTEEKWRTFDIENAGVLHSILIAANTKQTPTPAPTLPAFPSDFDERAVPGVAIIQGLAVNIRQRPTTGAPVIGTLLMHVPGRYIPLSALRPDEQVSLRVDGTTALWQPVALGNNKGVRGWAWTGGLRWDAVPIPFELQAMKLLHERMTAAAHRTRQISLELAGISDDLLKDSALLAALIDVRETAIPT